MAAAEERDFDFCNDSEASARVLIFCGGEERFNY